MVFDFATYDLSGRCRALIEAKLRYGATASWAALTRRNWLSHGHVPPADYLILIVPDQVFIWPSEAAPDSQPSQCIQAEPLLAPYLGRIGVASGNIGPRAFEQVVHWWLEDLTLQRPKVWTEGLRKSGLVELLAGQQVLVEDSQ